MKIIPIVFCFDDNLTLPAAVCISSLLEHANIDTFYDIFILHDDSVEYPNNGYFDILHNKYVNFKITYLLVGDVFRKSYEIRGITIATYYRLLIPELIPQYDKIMYHDVDVIFRSDLSDIFQNTDIENYFFAGVISTSFLDPEIYTKRKSKGFEPYEYIIAGNLIINSKLIGNEGLVERFKYEALNNKYDWQDQDIINIVCKGRIKKMPSYFGGSVGHFRLLNNFVDQDVFTIDELIKLSLDGIIHYNGAKPWKEYCLNFDIWWEYYRKSVYFDPKLYFDFYNTKLTHLDDLSLWKRLKLLVRFFKTGGSIK